MECRELGGAFGAGFSDSDGNGVLVDIQAEVECNRHGVVDRLYFTTMNQNASPAGSEDVLAALPIRAIRVNMNGTRVRDSHTTFFNLQTAAAVPTNSHKV